MFYSVDYTVYVPEENVNKVGRDLTTGVSNFETEMENQIQQTSSLSAVGIVSTDGVTGGTNSCIGATCRKFHFDFYRQGINLNHSILYFFEAFKAFSVF